MNKVVHKILGSKVKNKIFWTSVDAKDDKEAVEKLMGGQFEIVEEEEE